MGSPGNISWKIFLRDIWRVFGAFGAPGRQKIMQTNIYKNQRKKKTCRTKENKTQTKTRENSRRDPEY